MNKQMVEGSEETYPMPKDGWVCFHCGERFMSPGAAQDHFGAEPGALAGCQIKAGEERGLLMELRKAERRAAEQLERALKVERENERLECRISSLSVAMKSFKPFRNCDSMNEVFNIYDSIEGRALAAEERLKELEKEKPCLQG